MKNFFTISMLILFAMICSCQKQDSAAEQQLAQRKAELDARDKALDERERALAEREKVRARPRTIPSDVQSRSQVPDAAQLKAERERRLQQLPPLGCKSDSPNDSVRLKNYKERGWLTQ
jgi:hypothetical protein